MTSSSRSLHRTPPRVRIRPVHLAGLLALVAALAALAGRDTPMGASSSSGTTSAAPSPAARADARPAAPPGPLGEADGAIPDGTTVFDDAVPGVVNLDPDLLGALRRAATAAGDGGIQFQVDSGWRSEAYQSRLLRDAIAKYGSEAEARRWVATPTTSAHVSGDAVDIGGRGADAWLSEHGAAFGLCQIYGNEPWHYELRPEAGAQGCPAMYADPTHDPRMQR